MSLTLITAPTVNPLNNQDVAEHVRADLSAEAMLVDAYIGAIAAKAEAVLHRALITQAWELGLDSFPCIPQPISNSGRFSGIRLPLSPVQSIVSITYIDVNGDTQTVAPADYYLDGDDPVSVVPVYGKAWPSARMQPGSVKIRYICGYGDQAENIPAAIRVWMLMNVANLYENRETVVVGKSGIADLSTLADSLLDQYRLVQF